MMPGVDDLTHSAALDIVATMLGLTVEEVLRRIDLTSPEYRTAVATDFGFVLARLRTLATAIQREAHR